MNKRAAEEDVEAQRQELMAGFDDALRKREHEFRKKADDLSNAALASELKVGSMQSTVLCQRADVKLCYCTCPSKKLVAMSKALSPFLSM